MENSNPESRKLLNKVPKHNKIQIECLLTFLALKINRSSLIEHLAALKFIGHLTWKIEKKIIPCLILGHMKVFYLDKII